MAANKILRTYSKIGGEKFLIVFLVLFTSPFFFSLLLVCLLPLLILSAPMKRIWQKENNVRAWRWGSSIWLGISLTVAIYCAVLLKKGEGNTFPITLPNSANDSECLWEDGALLYGAVVGLNISFVTGLMMIPLSIASYIETKRSSQSFKVNT